MKPSSYSTRFNPMKEWERVINEVFPAIVRDMDSCTGKYSASMMKDFMVIRDFMFEVYDIRQQRDYIEFEPDLEELQKRLFDMHGKINRRSWAKRVPGVCAFLKGFLSEIKCVKPSEVYLIQMLYVEAVLKCVLPEVERHLTTLLFTPNKAMLLYKEKLDSKQRKIRTLVEHVLTTSVSSYAHNNVDGASTKTQYRRVKTFSENAILFIMAWPNESNYLELEKMIAVEGTWKEAYQQLSTPTDDVDEA